MKSYSHIRSKSDTDFNFDKTSLDITHYNLKQFREDIPIGMSCNCNRFLPVLYNRLD